jgi:hypothetical protein
MRTTADATEVYVSPLPALPRCSSGAVLHARSALPLDILGLDPRGNYATAIQFDN